MQKTVHVTYNQCSDVYGVLEAVFQSHRYKKSSATVTNFEIKVGKMMKYEKSFYCILFREMNDEHTAKYLRVLVQESSLMLIS